MAALSLSSRYWGRYPLVSKKHTPPREVRSRSSMYRISCALHLAEMKGGSVSSDADRDVCRGHGSGS